MLLCRETFGWPRLGDLPAWTSLEFGLQGQARLRIAKGDFGVHNMS